MALEQKATTTIIQGKKKTSKNTGICNEKIKLNHGMVMTEMLVSAIQTKILL